LEILGSKEIRKTKLILILKFIKAISDVNFIMENHLSLIIMLIFVFSGFISIKNVLLSLKRKIDNYFQKKLWLQNRLP
jgi:hypothetical protein